jgi:hypothetical protein
MGAGRGGDAACIRSGRPERGGCRGARALGCAHRREGRCRGGHGDSGGGRGRWVRGVGSVCVRLALLGVALSGSGATGPSDQDRAARGHSPASLDLGAPTRSSPSMTCGTWNRAVMGWAKWTPPAVGGTGGALTAT